jgi:hypothetical protein
MLPASAGPDTPAKTVVTSRAAPNVLRVMVNPFLLSAMADPDGRPHRFEK